MHGYQCHASVYLSCNLCLKKGLDTVEVEQRHTAPKVFEIFQETMDW